MQLGYIQEKTTQNIFLRVSKDEISTPWRAESYCASIYKAPILLSSQVYSGSIYLKRKELLLDWQTAGQNTVILQLAS